MIKLWGKSLGARTFYLFFWKYKRVFVKQGEGLHQEPSCAGNLTFSTRTKQQVCIVWGIRQWFTASVTWTNTSASFTFRERAEAHSLWQQPLEFNFSPIIHLDQLNSMYCEVSRGSWKHLSISIYGPLQWKSDRLSCWSLPLFMLKVSGFCPWGSRGYCWSPSHLCLFTFQISWKKMLHRDLTKGTLPRDCLLFTYLFYMPSLVS